MLVALISSSWSQAEQNTIKTKKKALASAQGQALKKIGDISSLGDGEDLWLYSHGSSTHFAIFTAEELAGWLVKKVHMPPGERRVVLKGCKTGGYAKAVQDLLNAEVGFEKVVVAGFEGEASMTSSTGAMTVRRASEAEKRKASQLGALEEIRMRREAREKGVKKADVDGQVETARKKVERASTIYETEYDDGSSTFVAKDDRMKRRLARSEKVTTTTVPQTSKTGSDSDEDESTKMEIDDGSTRYS